MATLASPTLGKLITNARNMLNQPSASNSFWTDGELTEYINEGIRMYYAEVIQNLEGHFQTTTTLDIVSGAEEVSLPSDFFEARSLYIIRNNGWEILQYINDVTSGFSTTGGGNNNSQMYEPYYFFRANKLVLRPTPNFSQTGALRLEYVQFPDVLLNGGDQLTSQVSPIFKQLIEMYAVYKAKLKESMVNGVNMHAVPRENLNEIYTQFKDCINKRSAYPEFIRAFNPEGGC